MQTICLALVSLLIAPPDPARLAVEQCNEILRTADSFVFNASMWGEGEYAGRTLRADGRYLLARDDEDRSVLRLRTDATVRKPGFDEAQFESVRFDGSRHVSWHTDSGDVYHDGPFDPRYKGFSSITWSYLNLDQEQPLSGVLDGKLTHEGTRVVSGVLCDVILAERPGGQSVIRTRWSISQEDHLPRRIELLFTPDDAQSRVVREFSGFLVNVGIKEQAFTVPVKNSSPGGTEG